MQIKISVIIPVYNVEKYIDRCINSIVNQTLDDIEIIIVDDGSSDNSPKKCDDYAKNDHRIKTIHQKNAGAGFARNKGLEKANGEYIAFIDADDYVAQNMFEKLYNIAKEEDLDACSCGIRNINKDNPLMYDQFDYPEYRIIKSNKECREIALETLRGKNKKIGHKLYQKHRMAVWHTIFKKSIINDFNIKFPSEREVFSEDLSFNFYFYTNACRIGFIPDLMVFHCYNSNSLTATRIKMNEYPRLSLQLHSLLEYMNTNNYDERQIDSLRLFYVNYVISNIKNIVRYEKRTIECNIKLKEILNDKDSWAIIKRGTFISDLKWHRRIFLYLLYNKTMFIIKLISKITLN